MICGNDPEKHVEGIKFASAGFDHVYVYNAGPYQDGFFQFCKEVILNL